MPELSFVVIKTIDPERIKRFYELLGITFEEEKHGNGPKHFAATLGSVVLEIYPLRPSETSDRTALGFTVSNVSGVFDALCAVGYVYSTPFERDGKRIFTVFDPDGRYIELTQK